MQEYEKRECKCGGFKFKTSKMCHDCRTKKSRAERGLRTLAQLRNKGTSRTKWNQVRRDANQRMEAAGVEKKCAQCGFDVVVECCHVKDIADFPEDAILNEVNHENNLVYLCPNHHAMFDRGLLNMSHVAES